MKPRLELHGVGHAAVAGPVLLRDVATGEIVAAARTAATCRHICQNIKGPYSQFDIQLRVIMFPVLDSDPESDFQLDVIPDPYSVPLKSRIATPIQSGASYLFLKIMFWEVPRLIG